MCMLSIDVTRCGDDESIAKLYVLKPENVDLHGLLHGMVPLLVPDVFLPVGFSLQAHSTVQCACVGILGGKESGVQLLAMLLSESVPIVYFMGESINGTFHLCVFSFCSKAICFKTCQNGGTCSSPDTCNCASGWTGSTCSEGL